MSANPVTATVTSKDGVQFIVATDQKSVPFEKAFAAKFTADELSQNEDFLRSVSVTEAPGPTDETPVERIAELVAPSSAPRVEALDRASAKWGYADYFVGDRA